nr:receptor-interacting serine/threonine-protein kinase 2-like [Anolis sagrei ordinatus]
MSSSLVPIISQKDLESISLVKMGVGFALKAFHTPGNMDVSLKLLSNRNTTERDLKALLQEVACTRRMQCNRLIPSVGICHFQGFFGIVTEWMHNGSLSSLIHEHALCPDLPFPLSVRILSDVSEGLNYLHSLQPHVLHCNLKPSNVLIDRDYRAKISDYGLATWRSQQIHSLLQNCNNRSSWDLLYLSPEILQGGCFSQEGDMYSFGMMCWEVLSRQKPLRGKKTLLEAMTGVCSGVRPGIELPFLASSLPHRNKLVQLIVLCWHHDALKRPNVAECTALLQDILSTFRKETISDAIYNVIHAKDCAIDAAKGPVAYVLERDRHNLEILCTHNNNGPNKEIDLKSKTWSDFCPDRSARGPGSEAEQTFCANSDPHHDARRGKYSELIRFYLLIFVPSFGMMCWEVLSRQKPLRGKKTLLEAMTGVCSGVRPGIELPFLASSLPHRNKLVQLIVLCWHHDALKRPNVAECTALLQDILSTFRKETISDAIYNVIHAKDCAIDAAKGPVAYVLERDRHNLEILCTHNNNGPNKEIDLKSKTWSDFCPDRSARGPGSEAEQTFCANSDPHHDARRGRPVCNSEEPGSPPHSFSSVLMPDSSVNGRSTLPFCKEPEGKRQPPPELVQHSGHRLTNSNCQKSWSENKLKGSCYQQKNCSILACGRETILHCMTEGRLNHLLDVLRSQQLLSRMDYECITSFPTLTARSRALLDTCLGLGEKAAQTVVSVLSTSKCSPLLQSFPANAVN